MNAKEKFVLSALHRHKGWGETCWAFDDRFHPDKPHGTGWRLGRVVISLKEQGALPHGFQSWAKWQREEQRRSNRRHRSRNR